MQVESIHRVSSNHFRIVSVKRVILLVALLGMTGIRAETTDELPTLDLPDAKIAEVYRGNWVNTLAPCKLAENAFLGVLYIY